MSLLAFVEYVWVDNTDPVKKLRSKARMMEVGHEEFEWSLLEEDWNFDGSSTNQGTSDNSERILKPVRIYSDPFRGGHNKIVLCEVMMPDGKPHESNTRSQLRKRFEENKELKTWWGFEQEYCLMKDGNILGWPTNGNPDPQGPYYCGVGSNEVVGREVVEEHAQACLDTGIMLYGINAEVMLGQWEFQVGHRGFSTDEEADPLKVSDDLWMARYLLYRVGEKYKIWATLDPKPKKGNWNGSGMHTNFSDCRMRDEKYGKTRIKDVLAHFKDTHSEHQKCYGHNNSERLTGEHETSPFDSFSYGVANRGSSIRMPNITKEKGYGYLEDRRPAANADPYEVIDRILKTLVETRTVIL